MTGGAFCVNGGHFTHCALKEKLFPTAGIYLCITSNSRGLHGRDSPLSFLEADFAETLMKQKRMAPPFQRGGSGGAKKRGALNRKQHNKHQAPSTQISRESLGFRIFLFLSCDWRSFLRQWGSFHPLRSQRKAFPHCRDLPLYHIKFKRSPRQRQSFELLRSGLC